MNTNDYTIISKERDVRTYVEMWRASRFLLMMGKDVQEESYYHFMASIVFTAFSLEAYLNHLGPNIFKCWDSLERLSPKDKLNVVAEKIGIEVDYGVRPWQVVKELFGFRNDIAHGKSIKASETIKRKTSKIKESEIFDWTKTEWEKYCTERNASRARKDVAKIILKLHALAGIDELPLQTGIQSMHINSEK